MFSVIQKICSHWPITGETTFLRAAMEYAEFTGQLLTAPSGPALLPSHISALVS